MTSIETVHTVYLKLDNRPGTLEHAARLLGEKHINIDSLSAETVGSTGVARFLTHKAKEAVRVLHAGGIESFESDAFVVAVKNAPSELARLTGEIAAAGVNVEAVFTTTDGRLVFRTSDNERAVAILKKL